MPGTRAWRPCSSRRRDHSARRLAVERLDAAAAPISPGTVATRRFALTVAPDAPRTQPYFRRRPLVRNGYYDWTGVPAEWRGLPFEPPPVIARLRLTVAGAPLTLEREVVYRYRDQAVGEIRRPLFVAQDFDVALESVRRVVATRRRVDPGPLHGHRDQPDPRTRAGSHRS